MIDTFDIVIELSRKKLMNYILENVLIQNLPIVTKFVLKASSQAGGLQAILDAVDLKLQPGTDQATLVYHVYGATIHLTNQVQIGFSDGTINIGLKIIPGSPFKVVLQSAEFQTSQTQQISDPKTFFPAVNGILTAMLDTTTEWDLFSNTPAQTQLLMVGLVFNGKVACLDGDTVVAVIGQGDLSKVTNFLKNQDFGVALSAAWVKNNLLFPSEITLLDPTDVANALGISVSEAQNKLQNPDISFMTKVRPLLPAPFGSGSPKQTVQGVDIFYDSIDFALGNGAIKMDGKFHGEAFCAHIHNGAFSETIKLAMLNQQIQASFFPNPPQPTYSVEFDFWCALGFLFLASNVLLVTGIVATSILISIATSITVQQQNLSAGPFSVPAFDQVNWVGIEIFTEGLVLLGQSTAAVGYDTTLSSVDFKVKTQLNNVEDAGPGVYHFPGSLACKAQDFQYEEFRQDVTLTLDPTGIELLYPVTTTWVVHGQAITSGSGQLNYNDQAHTATPPFNEIVLPNHQICIDYVVSPGIIIPWKPGNGLNVLQLTFPKSDYDFSVLVELRVQDASGHTYTHPLMLDIETDTVQFGQDWFEFQKECGLASKIRISKIKTVPQVVVHGGETLTPEEVTQVIREVVSLQPGQAVDIMKSLNATYGSRTVLKAFAPPAKSLVKIKG